MEAPFWKYPDQLPARNFDKLNDEYITFPIDSVRPQRQFKFSTIKGVYGKEHATFKNEYKTSENNENESAYYPQ